MTRGTITATWSVNDRQCIRPKAEYTEALGLANAIWCPVGRPAGRAFVLMLRRDLDETVRNKPAGTLHKVTVECSAAGELQGVSDGKIDWYGHFVSAMPAIPYRTASLDCAMLVEFADERNAINSLCSFTGDCNLLMPEAAVGAGINHWWTGVYSLGSLYRSSLTDLEGRGTREGDLHTIHTFFEKMWSSTYGVTRSAAPQDLYAVQGTGISQSRHVVPRNWSFKVAPAWDAICDFLWHEHLYFPVYDPIKREYRIDSQWYIRDPEYVPAAKPDATPGYFRYGLLNYWGDNGITPFPDRFPYLDNRDAYESCKTALIYSGEVPEVGQLPEILWTIEKLEANRGHEGLTDRHDQFSQINMTKTSMLLKGGPVVPGTSKEIPALWDFPLSMSVAGSNWDPYPDSNVVPPHAPDQYAVIGDWLYYHGEGRGDGPPPRNFRASLNNYWNGAEWCAIQGVIYGAFDENGVKYSDMPEYGWNNEGYYQGVGLYQGRYKQSINHYAGIVTKFELGREVKMICWRDYGVDTIAGERGTQTVVYNTNAMPSEVRRQASPTEKRGPVPIGMSSLEEHVSKWRVQSHLMQDKCEYTQFVMYDDDEDGVPAGAMGSAGGDMQWGRIVRIVPGLGAGSQPIIQVLGRCIIVDIADPTTASNGRGWRTKGRMFLGRLIGGHYKYSEFSLQGANNLLQQYGPWARTLPTYAIDSGISCWGSYQIYPEAIPASDYQFYARLGNAYDSLEQSGNYFDEDDRGIDIISGGLYLAIAQADLSSVATYREVHVQLVLSANVAPSDEQPADHEPSFFGHTYQSGVSFKAASEAEGLGIQVPFTTAALLQATRGQRVQLKVFANGTGASLGAGSLILVNLMNGAMYYGLSPYYRNIEGLGAPPWGPPY